MARFIRGPFGIGFVNVASVRTVSDVYFEPGPLWSGETLREHDYAVVMLTFKSNSEQKYRKMIRYPKESSFEERLAFCERAMKQHEEDLKKFLADLE